jgi:hypothetical protein
MSYLKKLGLASAFALALMAIHGTVVASATTLEVGGVAKNSAVEVRASLKSGTSLLFKDGTGATGTTCTTSEIKAKTEGAFTNTQVNGKVSSFTLANCSHTTKVIKPGRLWVVKLGAGGTDGRVFLSEAEVTFVSTVFGVSCTSVIDPAVEIGPLTGVSSGNATIDVDTTLNMGICGGGSWTATYTVTSPSGLGVVD